MARIKGVYYFDGDNFIRISYKEHLIRTENDPEYALKHFAPAGSLMFEVENEDHIVAEKRAQSKEYYQMKKENKLSSDGKLLYSNQFDFDVVEDIEVDIEGTVENRVLREELRLHVDRLDRPDRDFALEIIDKRLTQRQLAKKYKVRQATISNRYKRLIEKLQNYYKEDN